MNDVGISPKMFVAQYPVVSQVPGDLQAPSPVAPVEARPAVGVGSERAGPPTDGAMRWRPLGENQKRR